MWIWQECEDYSSARGDVQVIDDWGAAAMRCVRLGARASATFEVWPSRGDDWGLSLRYRLSSDDPSTLTILCNGEPHGVELHPTGRGWGWVIFPLIHFDAAVLPKDKRTEVELIPNDATCEVDGFFLHDEPIDLPDRVQTLDAMVGEKEAGCLPAREARFPDIPAFPAQVFRSPAGFVSDLIREAAGDTGPVLDALAQKPCPYIVKAFGTPGGTDYNSDYSWHALDKEKRWDLPAAGMIGLVNPNSDFCLSLGFSLEDDVTEQAGSPFEALGSYALCPVVHLSDLIVYEVALGEGLRCEVAFRCVRSDLVEVLIQADNTGSEERVVSAWALWGKTPQTNPPEQRYVLPGQKFGAGVTTTAGSIAWNGYTSGYWIAHCYYEWFRSRCRGRRLLAVVAQGFDELARMADEAQEPLRPGVFGELAQELWQRDYDWCLPLVVPPGRTISAAFALNLRRFTLHDTWNPEITPELYKKETEQEAVEAGYRACVEALSADLEEEIRASIEPYRTFPRITLPQDGWEADFYACLELPRASTFSPYGALATPFYNFCRVHAHEPFGWWSYGMHAHESLCTLFTNITDPGLSASFLLGHIRHQREDGMYPYGVSHTINPRLKTQEATAPLIVWEAWNSYLWSGDREFLREAYESGKRNQEWWLATRDRCGEGLCHWLNTSGESVRDDDGLPTWQVTGGSQYQEALDLNSYLLVQERTLSKMALELGLPEEVQHYREMTDRRARTMNAHMWHEGDGCYYGIGEVVPSWADVKDISTFFPLWAGLAPEGRFERIVELVTDPETFGLPYGPPVLAANEPRFGPEAHWCGANWVEMSLFVILGLKNYGYYQLAADLAHQNTKMVFDELEKYGHFREYFNSMTGEGVDLIDYIWTAMPAHFIVNVFLGIEPKAEHLEVLPALPGGWDDVRIDKLHVRGIRVSLHVKRDAGASVTSATVNAASAEVTAGRGVLVPWDDLADGTVIEITQPLSVPEARSAPPEAATDWSDIAPHRYPDDEELVRIVRASMKTRGELGR